MQQGVILCALALAAGCSSDRPASEPDLRTEVQIIYDRIGQAVERKDIAGVSQCSLPDASVRYADGTELTLPKWKERAQAGWANLKEVRSRFVVREVRADGGGADATYAETHEMKAGNPDGAADHVVHYEGEWQARLERTVAGWRIKRSVELKRRITRDGALIDEQPKPQP